jgi:hypothetical protein
VGTQEEVPKVEKKTGDRSGKREYWNDRKVESLTPFKSFKANKHAEEGCWMLDGLTSAERAPRFYTKAPTSG